MHLADVTRKHLFGAVNRPAWVLFMRWNDLAFLHWSVDPNALRDLIPQPLRLDTYEGRAWIGITPFWMSGVRPRLMPPIPGLSSFLELNVRTYVRLEDRPGVWFLSLDATSSLAVRAARRLYHLPYHDARMSIEPSRQGFHYVSSRIDQSRLAAKFDCRYGPTGEVYRAKAGTLDHWLTERYSLYTADRSGRVYRGDIYHTPWPLEPAAAEIDTNTMAEACGILLPDETPVVHFARRLDVRAAYLVPAT